MQFLPCGFPSFEVVKWIESIEFVEDFRHLGAGCGGYNEITNLRLPEPI